MQAHMATDEAEEEAWLDTLDKLIGETKKLWNECEE